MAHNICSTWRFTIGIELNGEVFNIVIHIWVVAWGTEKLIEHKNFLQSTILWCLDYVSWWHKNMLFACCRKPVNDLYCKTLFRKWKFSTSTLYSWLFLEITRILNHLLATQRMQWMLVLLHRLWAFEEREKLMNFMNVFRCTNACRIYPTWRCLIWCR